MRHFFGEQAENHCQIVFVGENEDIPEDLTDIIQETKDITGIPEGSYHTLSSVVDATQLVEQMEKTREENGSACYTLDMYVTAQIKTRVKHQTEQLKKEETPEEIHEEPPEELDTESNEGDYVNG